MEARDANVVVTGGGSGIGRGIATAFARRGANVVLADIEHERASETAETLRSHGGRVAVVATDVADPASTDDLARAAQDLLGGPVQFVCANAGVIVVEPLADLTVADWQWLLGINVVGAANTARSFLPHFRAQEGIRHFVVTASMASLRASDGPGMTLYAASKYGVLGFCEALVGEIDPDGIGLSIVFPGPVSTDIRRGSLRRHPHRSEPTPDTPLARVDTMDPVDAGEVIVDGVLAGRRYVPTHPDMWPEVEAVQRRIAAGFGH